ncbi:MAG: hypothetical protein AB7Q17_09235 [Phycisphaerae bacterium]
MPKTSKRGSRIRGPGGALRSGRRVARPWRWERDAALLSAPVRCKREQWYAIRVRLKTGAPPTPFWLMARFLRDEMPVRQLALPMRPVLAGRSQAGLIAWAESPRDATHVQVRLLDAAAVEAVDEVDFHAVAEPDPVGHPAANVPRWSSVGPARRIERVVVPSSLGSIAGMLHGQMVEIAEKPRSVAALAARSGGASLVLDPAWTASGRLTLTDVERLAANAYVLVDLDSFAALLTRAGARSPRVITLASAHELLSARVEYADAATRGFALQDAAPLTVVDEIGVFTLRALRANAAWRRYADDVGFATLLSSQGPWEEKSGDVVSAARPIGGGELIVTDLPWLVAKRHAQLVAPRVAEHLLRMHTGGPLDEGVQFWTRWLDAGVVVRDVSDLARRYPPLCAVRWASAGSSTARLGVALPAAGAAVRRSFCFSTGRCDLVAPHDGLPAEPAMIFMRWLAREAREQTAWAQRVLAGRSVVWQFDAAAGTRYALHFDAARADLLPPSTERLHLRLGLADATDAESGVIRLADDLGIGGDGSIEFQQRFHRLLCDRLEAAC